MKFARNLVLGLFLCVLAAVQVNAQSYPLPGSRTEPSVLCNGCAGANSFGQANAGLPTYPYSPPLMDHVGRYVDSQSTANFQNQGIRSIRARTMRTFPHANGSAPPRIYIQMGNAVGGYALDTFFSSKLPGELKSVGSVVSRVDRWGAPFEKMAVWDGYMYPEHTTASGWYAPLVDQQDPLGKGGPFDVDDRGNLYSTFPTFGWGIAKDDGRSDAGHFPKVVQMVGCYKARTAAGTPCVDDPAVASTPIDPKTYPNTRHDDGDAGDSILAVRSGNKYYAIVASRTNGHAVYDVTDATAPKSVVRLSGAGAAIRRYDRSDAVARVAYVDGNKQLAVISYAELARGGTPTVFAGKDGGFVDVSFDENGNIWATEASRLWKFTPAGSTYVPIEYTPYGPNFRIVEAISVAGGHIVVVGTDFTGTAKYDLRLMKIEAGGPRLIPTDDFFKNYYHGGLRGYAEPGQYTQPFDVQLVKWANKTYLLYSANGLGDVFEIQAGDSIQAALKGTSFGTANPNIPAGSETGPFPGDTVTFTATSSNPQVAYDVSWDFGNEEAGTANLTLAKTGRDVKHQYTGLATAAKVTAAKTVRAVAVQDSTIGSQTIVNLKLPKPRVGVSGQTNAVASDISTTSPLVVVAGSTFRDASDGSLEGHYGVWTIDGTATKLKPNDTLPVGGVGTHTLTFQAFYGKHDPATFIGTDPYATPVLTIAYVVKPFRVELNAPGTVGTDTVRFTGSADVTSDKTILSATQWNVSWNLTGGTAAGGVSSDAITPVSGTYNVGVIPNFDVAKADVKSGSTVTLQITVDSSGLSAPAQPYAQASASSLLTTPDPLIEQTGCANAGSPCTFTAKSVSGGSLSDWTLLWTVRKGTAPVSISNSSAASIQPNLEQGTYTVSLKATKTVFEKIVEKSVTVEQSLCGPLPTDEMVSINKIGCHTSCAPGTTVTFSPTYRGYRKQTCDSYSWTFGDGTGAAGEEVTHAYTTSGTKNVTFSITNTNGTFNETTTVTITGGTPPPPPPPPPATCAKPLSANFTWTGCNGTCRTTDSLKFTGTKNNGQALQQCDSVTWTYGPGDTSSVKSPSRTFSTAGTYDVTLVVTNSEGTSAPVTKQITIANPTSNSCPAPGPGNYAIIYTGAQSNCTISSSCQANEVISFESPDYLYNPSSCESYEWDLGDGSPKKTARNVQHAYTNDGTYDVSLKVKTSTGEFTYTRKVVITGGTPAQPTPELSATTFPAAAHKGKAVTFTATSNMTTTTGWTWNFGDDSAPNTSQAGAVSKTSTITHTFTRNGIFTVKATARNSTDRATAPVGTVQATITITEAPAIPTYTYLVPAVAHGPGDNGSVWRTDVQIYNPDPNVSVNKPLKMTASFKGSTFNLEVTKATHIYEDILGRLLDHNDQGAMIITTTESMVAPQIWTRTYNQTEGGGTFGQFIPAIRIDDNAGSGGAVVGEGKYYLFGLRHNANYRTNLAFVNPNSVPINATVTVRDDRFLAVAQFTRTLDPFVLDQKRLDQLVPSIPTDRPLSLQIEVPAGRWVMAFASYIDNISGDPIFLQAVRESEVASADHKVSVIPGVGHTGQWRSDVTIFNPDIENSVQFDLDYYDAGGNKLASAPGIVLRSREFLQYSDILKQGVLGSVIDGLGTLKITATTPVPTNRYPITFARTYFDGGAKGTFGQGISGFAAAKTNVKAGKPALIPGVRNNAGYRTNFGLFNPTNATVTAKISLLDPINGTVALSREYQVKPNETIVGPYNGNDWNNLETGTLKIEATGDIWAFASIIDKNTQDPEYVVATPAQQ